jgi:hypothetical protein
LSQSNDLRAKAPAAMIHGEVGGLLQAGHETPGPATLLVAEPVTKWNLMPTRAPIRRHFALS